MICPLQSLCLYKETEEKAENHERTPTPRTGLYLMMPLFSILTVYMHYVRMRIAVSGISCILRKGHFYLAARYRAMQKLAPEIRITGCYGLYMT